VGFQQGRTMHTHPSALGTQVPRAAFTTALHSIHLMPKQVWVTPSRSVPPAAGHTEPTLLSMSEHWAQQRMGHHLWEAHGSRAPSETVVPTPRSTRSAFVAVVSAVLLAAGSLQNTCWKCHLYTATHRCLFPRWNSCWGIIFPFKISPFFSFHKRNVHCQMSSRLSTWTTSRHFPSWTQLMLADTQFKHSLVVYREDQIPRYALGQHTVCWIQLGHWRSSKNTAAQRVQEEPPTLKTEELISKLKSGSTEDTQDVAVKHSVPSRYSTEPSVFAPNGGSWAIHTATGEPRSDSAVPHPNPEPALHSQSNTFPTAVLVFFFFLYLSNSWQSIYLVSFIVS